MMTTRFRLSRLLLFVLLLSAHAGAESLTGTFLSNNPAQRLTLSQSSDGSITGDLQRGSTSFRVSLAPYEGQLVGAAEDARGTS